MKVIGITGTSGSGKTTLSQILNKKNDVSVIDADKVAREISVPGTAYNKAIEEAFGKEVFLEDGNLNRKKLANKIYNDNEALSKLNNLTFKYVIEEILLKIDKLKENKEIKYAVIDVPLLFESGLDKHCDEVISLIADKDLKIKRICKRDNIDKKTAESRLSIQHNDEFYIEKSDYVIVNNEDCDLEAEFNKVVNK